MSNQATNTAAAAAPAKAKKPSIVDTFLKGCAKGFKVGIENITPAMILGYVLVYILKETGLMDILGTLIGHYARIVLVTDTNKKWHPLLIAVCLLDAAISLVIMRVILAAMGVQ